MNKVLLVFFVSLFGFTIHSQTTATAQNNPPNNRWNQTGSWVGGVVPGCFDQIIIPAGVFLDVTATVDLGPNPGANCGPVTVIVQGDLRFQTGKKLKLPTGSQFIVEPGGTVVAGGGSGSSSYIEIGTETVWDAGQGDILVPITLCEGCSQLGVSLLAFDLKQDGREVNLYWSTASEENNDYFTIERSDDESIWNQIALIDGNGTTSTTNYYNYQDVPQLDETYYYRLYQTDFDGSREFLGELSVVYESELRVIKRYNLLGQEITGEPQGLVIEVLSDQTARKVYYGK